MKHTVNPVYYQDYILAGKPFFTLKNIRSGNEEFYRVVRSGCESGLCFVKNRINETIGVLTAVMPDLEIWNFTAKKDLFSDFQKQQARIFDWFWTKMMMSQVPVFVELHYDGRCAHCRRELTHPESIPIGIGPDCFKKLGLTHKPLITHETISTQPGRPGSAQ